MMPLLCFIRRGQSAGHKRHPGALRNLAVPMTAFCERAAVSCAGVSVRQLKTVGIKWQAAEQGDEADEAFGGTRTR